MLFLLLAGCAGSAIDPGSGSPAPASFRALHDVLLTEARVPTLVYGGRGDNCVAVQAEVDTSILAGAVTATWEANTALTEELYIDISYAIEGVGTDGLSSAGGASPLATQFERQMVIPEGEWITIYIGSSRESYGGAALQEATLEIEVTHDGKLTSWTFGCTVAN